jgi:glycosyltransferase involved in cell wall biosynthesis
MSGPELSVVVPALNEEKTVSATLTRVLEVFDREKIDGEVILVDDASADRTGTLADEIAGKDRRARVIHRSGGKKGNLGSSLREGFRNARGEYVIVLDCDLSHDPADIPKLLRRRDEADIIVGSRYVKGGTADMPLQRVILSRTYNFIAKALLGLSIRDVTTGYKLYKKKMLDDLGLQSDGFGVQVEIIVKAHLKGYTAKEVPIHYTRSDKKSTLIYREQFASYMLPLLHGLAARWFRRGRLT